MRPLPVVMVDVHPEHAFEVASEEPEPGRATEAAHDVSAPIADSRRVRIRDSSITCTSGWP